MRHEKAHRLFGIELCTELDLPGAWSFAARAGVADRVALIRRDEETLRRAHDEPAHWQADIDGRPLAVWCSDGGGFDATWGDDCRARFSREPATLEWAARHDDHGWHRVLLDTFSFLIALELGREALHAACVVVDGRAVAIAAPSGTGKSTLAAALLERGATLLSDDITVIEIDGADMIAHPGAPLMTIPKSRTVPGSRPVTTVADELWAEVAVVEDPCPLEALVLLRRQERGRTEIELLARSPLPVLPWLLAFPRTRDRELARFDLAAALADRVRVMRFTSDKRTSPDAVAGYLLNNLAPLRASSRPGDD